MRTVGHPEEPRVMFEFPFEPNHPWNLLSPCLRTSNQNRKSRSRSTAPTHPQAPNCMCGPSTRASFGCLAAKCQIPRDSSTPLVDWASAPLTSTTSFSPIMIVVSKPCASVPISREIQADDGAQYRSIESRSCCGARWSPLAKTEVPR